MKFFADGRVEAENEDERVAYGEMLASLVVDAAQTLLARAGEPSAASGVVTLPALEARALTEAAARVRSWGLPPARVYGPGAAWTRTAAALHSGVLAAAIAMSNRTTLLPEGAPATVPSELLASLRSAVDELLAWVTPERGTAT